jgi:hypothetical protein
MKPFPTVNVAFLIAAAVLCGPPAASAYTKTGTVYATDGSYADVSAAVANASPNDTVRVPAGSFTWDSQLLITKGISLIGAGADKTVVTSAYSGSFLISYFPSDYSLNTPFRVSGFTFNFANKSGGIILNYDTRYRSLTIQTKIRIDHNTFQNARTQALVVNGMRGVADNNTFTGTPYTIRFENGDSRAWWDNWEGLVFGKPDNNFYVEDNTITVYEVVADCQYSNRYAFRYNTIVATTPGGSYPLFDMHGNHDSVNDGADMWSCFGGELYGNHITTPEGYVLDQRGGRSVVFYNWIVGNTRSTRYREEGPEYCDERNPTTNPQPQHVSSSYNWANYKTVPSVALAVGYIAANGCPTYQIAQNVDFWNHSLTYDGTVPGVGCGESLPAACTPGDGYWLTTQSCTSIMSHVGRNPETPISGTLYRCSAPNTWSSFYKPLQYPHPLRAQAPPTDVTIKK